VLTIQHICCETPGKIEETLRARGFATERIQIFKGHRVPEEIGEAAGLVVMGGPMGVYEQGRYPFLRQEARLIEQALKNDTPILGICLGSQLLASVLGARVKRGEKKEIGWHPVGLTESAAADALWKGVASPFIAYHWHGDVFDLPGGSVSLASSDLTPCQAFRHGENAYGFLFHMEVTETIVRDMVRVFADELHADELDGEEILRGAKEHLHGLNQIGDTVFQRWAELART
jgi:GMP synthase (glutamine-hydrolysing)